MKLFYSIVWLCRKWEEENVCVKWQKYLQVKVKCDKENENIKYTLIISSGLYKGQGVAIPPKKKFLKSYKYIVVKGWD